MLEHDPVNIGVIMGSKLQQCHPIHASQFIVFQENQARVTLNNQFTTKESNQHLAGNVGNAKSQSMLPKFVHREVAESWAISPGNMNRPELELMIIAITLAYSTEQTSKNFQSLLAATINGSRVGS